MRSPEMCPGHGSDLIGSQRAAGSSCVMVHSAAASVGYLACADGAGVTLALRFHVVSAEEHRPAALGAATCPPLDELKLGVHNSVVPH